MRRLVFIAVAGDPPDRVVPVVLMALQPRAWSLWSPAGPRFPSPRLLARTGVWDPLPSRPAWLVDQLPGTPIAVCTDWLAET